MASRTATYSTSDLSRRSGDIITEAIKRPVVLTQRKKKRLVLVSYEQWTELLGRLNRADPRRVGYTAEMPDDLADDVLRTIDDYLGDDPK
jgi:PHD/YefM family antitoxin component YafN of YafNO toxin-antitoxin module